MAKAPKQIITATQIFDEIKVSQSVQLTYTGFIRKTDSETELELSCGSGWEKIPTSIIDEVAFIRDDTLDGHEYPFVKIYLKEPETEEGKAFATVARFAVAACAAPRANVADKAGVDNLLLPQFLSSATDFQSILALTGCPNGMEYDRGKQCYYCVGDKDKKCVFRPSGGGRMR